MKELSIKLKCLLMRNGVEIWKESKRLENLGKKLLTLTKTTFVELDDETINTADILGIFTPQTLEAYNRRKKGQWQCQWGKWHDKTENCLCDRPEIPKFIPREFKPSPNAIIKIGEIREQLKDKLFVK